MSKNRWSQKEESALGILVALKWKHSIIALGLKRSPKAIERKLYNMKYRPNRSGGRVKYLPANSNAGGNQ